jgi:sodium/bile acid cotransporter 7
MVEFLQQRWFLILLILVLLVGMAWPDQTAPLAKHIPPNALVAIVTFIMALPLETSRLWKAVRQPGPAWLGSFINSGLAPPLGWLASLFLPPELAIGMILAASAPCTLATAAVWTRRAGGNDAVAFLVTMITNLSCFLVVPFWFWLLIGMKADVNYGQVILGLVLYVVLPIIVAQILRQLRVIGAWATAHKHALSRLAQIGVLVMVFIGAVKCGERMQAITDRSLLSATNILTMIVGVIAVHVALLLIAITSSRRIGFERGDTIAVAFSGSQNSLMVGAYLAQAIGPLAILPMVAYHAAQLVIDTLIADRWRQQVVRPAVEAAG